MTIKTLLKKVPVDLGRRALLAAAPILLGMLYLGVPWSSAFVAGYLRAYISFAAVLVCWWGVLRMFEPWRGSVIMFRGKLIAAVALIVAALSELVSFKASHPPESLYLLVFACFLFWWSARQRARMALGGALLNRFLALTAVGFIGFDARLDNLMALLPPLLFSAGLAATLVSADLAAFIESGIRAASSRSAGEPADKLIEALQRLKRYYLLLAIGGAMLPIMMVYWGELAKGYLLLFLPLILAYRIGGQIESALTERIERAQFAQRAEWQAALYVVILVILAVS